MVDLLLRVASVAVLVILLHQVYWSRGGSKNHNAAGLAAMGIGALLAVLVTVRGLQQESVGFLYALHLLSGGAFFAALFTSGILGWRARGGKRFARTHHFVGKVTLATLFATLVVGVISRLSH